MTEQTDRRSVVVPVRLRPGPLWRAVAPDGTTWCESSSESEVRERARPGDIVQQQWIGNAERWLVDAEPCPAHRLVQHRDRKPPWCNRCGRDAGGALIGTPKGGRS